MTDPVETPIKVDPSISIAMILTGIRQLALVGGGAVTLGTMVKNHNFAGVVAWFQGNDFATTSVALGTLLTFIYGQWHAFWAKHVAIATAAAAPNKTAVVQPSRFTRFIYALFGRKI